MFTVAGLFYDWVIAKDPLSDRLASFAKTDSV